MFHPGIISPSSHVAYFPPSPPFGNFHRVRVSAWSPQEGGGGLINTQIVFSFDFLTPLIPFTLPTEQCHGYVQFVPPSLVLAKTKQNKGSQEHLDARFQVVFKPRHVSCVTLTAWSIVKDEVSYNMRSLVSPLGVLYGVIWKEKSHWPRLRVRSTLWYVDLGYNFFSTWRLIVSSNGRGLVKVKQREE